MICSPKAASSKVRLAKRIARQAFGTLTGSAHGLRNRNNDPLKGWRACRVAAARPAGLGDGLAVHTCRHPQAALEAATRSHHGWFLAFERIVES
jgi:hypothetical protein